MADEGSQLFGSPSQRGSGSASQPRLPAWRIVLRTFTGSNAVAQATQALPVIQSAGRMPEAFVEPRKNGAIIAYGAYAQPDDAAAQRDLKRIRAMKVDGLSPYSGAFLAPPQGGAAGANPEYNLANAREEFGPSAKYTLQVAVYESDNRAEAMRLAERAVQTYRQEGELAFYYHGPNRSMVTIGVFGDRDFDPSSNQMSQELQALMARHPDHLYNGRGVREKLIDGTTRSQAPQLVRIP